MFQYEGKTALITGASMGIGATFARELAARGMDLTLVARSEDRLRELAGELAQRRRIGAEVVAADLSREDAAEEVRARVEELGMTVDLLVNNAGFGTHGRFHELDAARDHAATMLNVLALQDLTHAFSPGMIRRAR